MSDEIRHLVQPGGHAEFEGACKEVMAMTGATCAAVIVLNSSSGSGYSVIGPLESQVELPDILRLVADTLASQLLKSMQ
ncbi:hypothetical protein D3C85_1813190 [compost metagenome]